MSLLDPNIQNYIVDSFNIIDNSGNKLGSIKTSLWNNDKFTLVDSDKSVLLKTKKKRFGWKNKFQVTDASGNLIGTFSGDLIMEDKNGNKILTGKIPNEKDAPCKIYNNEGESLADLTTMSSTRFRWLRQPESWNLHILELSFDRILLLAFCLVAYGENYNAHQASGYDGGG